jgi:hypothetical protein
VSARCTPTTSSIPAGSCPASGRDGRPRRADPRDRGLAPARDVRGLSNGQGGRERAERPSGSSPTSRSGGRSRRTSSSPRRWPWAGWQRHRPRRRERADALRGVTIAPRMTFDAAALATRINQVADGLDVRPSSVRRGRCRPHGTVVNGRTGRTVRRRRAIARSRRPCPRSTLAAEVDADLVTTTVEPSVSTDEATAAKAAAADRMTAPSRWRSTTRRSRSRPTSFAR